MDTKASNVVESLPVWWITAQNHFPEEYRARFGRFLEWARLACVDPFADALERYLAERQQLGASAATVNGYFWAAKAVFKRWVVELNADQQQDTAAVAGWKLEQRLKRIRLPKVMKGKRAMMVAELKGQEVDAVIRRASRRNATLIEFLADTAVRVNEMLSVRLSDCRPFSKDLVFVTIHGKGAKEGAVWVRRTLFVRIRRLFKGREFLFESGSHLPLHPDNVFKEIKRSFQLYAGIHLTPHNMRHYFAFRALRAGVDVGAVQKALRHSDPVTTLTSYDPNRMTVAQLDELNAGHHGKRGRRSPKENE